MRLCPDDGGSKDATTEKIAIFIHTAMRISNLTQYLK
jgi:hypothetical protein